MSQPIDKSVAINDNGTDFCGEEKLNSIVKESDDKNSEGDI